jgi:hypothetical protein
MSGNIGVSTVEKFDPKNTGVAAGILFLSALELEILSDTPGGNSTPCHYLQPYAVVVCSVRQQALELPPSGHNCTNFGVDRFLASDTASVSNNYATGYIKKTVYLEAGP